LVWFQSVFNSENIAFVSPAILEAVSSQNSLGHLCPMNQLNDVQISRQQLHVDQRGDEILSSHSKDA